MRHQSLIETRGLIEDGMVPPLGQITPAASSDIASLLDRALSRDATQRPRTARELRAALMRVQAVATSAS